jgi:hypothetical protein
MPRPRAQVLGNRYGRLVVIGYGRAANGQTVAILAPADRALWPAAISVSWRPERMEVQHAA